MIDARIPLQAVVPLPVADPMEQYGRMLSLKSMLKRGEFEDEQLAAAKLQRAETERAIAEDQAFRQKIAVPGVSETELYSTSPKLAAAYLRAKVDIGKAKTETAKAELALNTDKAKRRAQLFSSAVDEPTFRYAIAQSVKDGVSTPEEAEAAMAVPWSDELKARLAQLGQSEMAYAERVDMFLKQEADKRASTAQNMTRQTNAVNEMMDTARINETARHNAVAEARQALPNTETEMAYVAADPSLPPAERERASQALRTIERHALAKRPITNITNTAEGANARERLAQALANGDLDAIRTVTSMRGGERLMLVDRVKQLNPKFSTSELDRKIKMEDDYANGQGSKSLRSFGIFLQHGGEAHEAVQKIRLTQSPLVNKPLNWWRDKMAGSPELKDLETALEPVRKEFESFLLGGKALYADDRKQAEIILSENSSPAQIQAALKRMGRTAEARLREENYRYKKVMGRDLQEPVSPEAIEGAKRIGVNVEFGEQAKAPEAQAAPKVGSVVDGYVFMGGNPADPKSWKKAK